MKTICSLVSLVLIAHFALGQDNTSTSRPVVNKDIVDMLHAGMSSEVVIAKIKSSSCNFDTSPSALVSLKESDVPDEVLLEMVRRPNRIVPPADSAPPASKPDPTPTPSRVNESASDNLPEYGDISEIRKMRRVFVIADDIDSQNLMIRALQQYEGFCDC